MTFTEWISKQQNRSDPVGDLARDIAQDKNWPDTGDLDSYSDYLTEMHAAAVLYKALERAWAEYSRI